MHAAEDGGIPLAGYFDSLVVQDRRDVIEAIERIRASINNKDLKEFCLYRGLTPPTRAGMFVGIEPYYETRYLGAALEHPNHEEIVLIEFGLRNSPHPSPARYSIAYDKVQRRIIHEDIPADIDAQEVAAAFAKKYVTNLSKLAAAGIDVHSFTYQMEAGFDADSQHLVRDFQMRQFKPRQARAEFSIEHPLAAKMVMGVTSGIDLVVCTSSEPDTISVVGHRAREDGFQVCYIYGANANLATNPNLPSYIDNLGLLITRKSLAVQEHGYFNAMMQAEHVVLLDQAEKISLESGERIRYKSNGTHASFTKLDQSGELKYKMKELLNR